jgi:hypothetical protein
LEYRLLADAVFAIHLAFIVFAVAGALCVMRRPRLAWLHVPAAAWAVWIELAGRICPLTPLENALLERAGLEGYSGGFVAHYLIPLIYPAGLTPAIQVAIGAGVLALNVALYARIIRRARARGSRAARAAW